MCPATSKGTHELAWAYILRPLKTMYGDPPPNLVMSLKALFYRCTHSDCDMYVVSKPYVGTNFMEENSSTCTS